jgi:hypothetical protein
MAHAMLHVESWMRGATRHRGTTAGHSSLAANVIALLSVPRAAAGWSSRRGATRAAIVDTLAAGRFYASTGVVLERAEVSAGELVVEIGAAERRPHTIALHRERCARRDCEGSRGAARAAPGQDDVRAVVTRDDGKQAWVQPARLRLAQSET